METITDQAEKETTYYFYGNGLNAQDNGESYFVYHFNNVGSTMAVTDGKGNVVETYNYTPYGELIDGEYREDIPFLYNGQYGVVTDGNGLYYMRARYYNVEIKRFINQDVLLGVLERISSLNRYSYVEGNPVSYLDPFGLDRIDTSGLHDFVSILNMILGFTAFFPTNGLTTAVTVAVNSLDFMLYVYDLKCAKEENDEYKIAKAIGGMAISIASIITAVIGFNVEAFYDKIIGFTGWGRAYSFAAQVEKTTELDKKLLAVANGSAFVITIENLIANYFHINSEKD